MFVLLAICLPKQGLQSHWGYRGKMIHFTNQVVQVVKFCTNNVPLKRKVKSHLALSFVDSNK